MIESINAEFEAYVKAELGDIAVVSEGRFISPKIQNYFKVWQHQAAKIEALEKPDCVFTMCSDDSPTPNTLESSCDGNVLWYMGNPGENKLPKFCWHCGGKVIDAAIAGEAQIAYPLGNVVGACVCGSWPGGECFKCERISPIAGEAT